jgi:hypothetical protein
MHSMNDDSKSPTIHQAFCGRPNLRRAADRTAPPAPSRDPSTGQVRQKAGGGRQRSGQASRLLYINVYSFYICYVY